MKEKINDLVELIRENFPQVHISLEEYDGEYFILLDDKNVYDSADFQNFLYYINMEYMALNKLTDVFITWDDEENYCETTLVISQCKFDYDPGIMNDHFSGIFTAEDCIAVEEQNGKWAA